MSGKTPVWCFIWVLYGINSVIPKTTVDKATKYGQCVSSSIIRPTYTELNISLKWYFGTFCIQYVCNIWTNPKARLNFCVHLYAELNMHKCIFINDPVVEYTVDSMVLLARNRLESGSKSPQLFSQLDFDRHTY